MEYTSLSLVIWLPVVFGVSLLILGKHVAAGTIRLLALVGAMLGLLVALPLWMNFDNLQPGFQFAEYHPWIDAFSINYHLGIDGISLLLILLNCVTTLIVVIAGWEVIRDRVPQYFASFLILSGIMNGVFCALDVALFYVFF